VAKFSEVFSTTAKVLLSLFLIALGMSAVYFVVVGRSYLFAAYLATWVVHAFYLGTLVWRFSRLRAQLREFGRGE
jgi:hypothetical protein